MAYAECETAYIALLRTLTTQFPTSAQVAAKDYSILDSGITTAAVLWPGAVGRGPKSVGNYERTWDIMMDLFQAYTDQYTTIAAFETLRAAVILKTDNNPNLSQTPGVWDTSIVSEGDIVPVNRRGDAPETGPVFVSQRFRVTVNQNLRAT